MNEEQARELLLKKDSVYLTHPDIKEKAYDFCEGYKAFLDGAKNEREAAAWAVKEAKAKGFKEYDPSKPLKAGDKIYSLNRNKSVMLAVIGKKLAFDGFSIIVAHADSPRLDLKQNPLYEEAGIGYFKTHYYGGIKKYQWTALPLALHGKIINSKGEEFDINIGEDEGDPVFYITDLMPHIAKNQRDKKMDEIISGEGLNIVNGSIPLGEGRDSVKLNILAALHEKYGITEADFLTSELCAVPAQKARDVGFDRSMIAGYGQDDRVCAYPAAEAVFDIDSPEKTCVTIFADKEEIGSEGVTGLRSAALEHFLISLCENMNADYKTVFAKSACLSSDVGGAFDPCFADSYEAVNSTYLNKGIAVMKYTGSRGKSGASDASAEFLSKIIRIFNENNIAWQTGEYGRVDQGGAGTVAVDIAMLNIDVIDAGVPILSMHSPVELAAKADIYMTYLAHKAFFNADI